MIKRKIKSCFVVLVACACVLGVVGASLANAATYYEEHRYERNKLALVRLLYNSAKRCISSGSWLSFSADFGQPSADNPDMVVSFNRVDLHQYEAIGKYTLFDGYELFNSDKNGEIYSKWLENAYITGGDYNGVSWCSEIDLIPKLMLELGIYSESKIDKLICNGEKPGLLELKTGWFGGGMGDFGPWPRALDIYNGSNWEYALSNGFNDINEYWWPSLNDGTELDRSGTNCQQNLKFMKEAVAAGKNGQYVNYIQNNTGALYHFYLTLAKADDKDGSDGTDPTGVPYFSKYMQEYLGTLPDPPSSGENYWVSYNTFNAGCAKIGEGTIVQPGPSIGNMIGLYDAASQKIYYHSVGDINRFSDLYYEISSNGKKKCEAFAEDLGADFENANKISESKIASLVIAVGEKDRKNCESRFNETIENYRIYEQKYNEVVETASKFFEASKDIFNGVYGFVWSEGAGTFNLMGDDSPIPSDYSDLGSIPRQLESWKRELEKGVDGVELFSKNNFDLLYSKIVEILDATTATDEKPHQITGTSITKEYLTETSGLVSEIKSEVENAEEKSQQLNEILFEYDPPYGPPIRPWEANVDPTNETPTRIECTSLGKFEDEIQELGLTNPPDIPDWTPTPPSAENPGYGQNGVGGVDGCYVAAGNVGWAVCSPIYGMAEATDGISALLSDWLSVDVDLYDNNSETYKAWQYFRTFANVAIIIVLLAVIFSQLTGVGIDNYGIKKLLPKIIMVAILINLSYIICELAVDLSNILGVGLNHLFQSIGRSVDSTISAEEVTATIVGSLFATFAGAGAVAGTVITIVGASGSGAMIVISLILVLLTALVAVLLFFMAIGARMIVIMMFTAIAPVAVVLYALPNTQSIFKKYLNVFKTALVVYPVCGALYGLSFVIKGIVLGDANNVPFHMALVAVCAPFLPFFALPMLTKGVLAGLGVAGAAFTALGNGIRSGIGKGRQAVEGSEAYRKGMERSKIRRASRVGERRIRRNDRRVDRGLESDTDRARMQELRNKVRSNTATKAEKDEYEKLKDKSNYRPSEARQARLTDAHEAVNKYASYKEKIDNGSNDIVATGVRQGDSYANQKAAKEASNWTDNFLKDREGNTWVANGRGGYSTVDSRTGEKRTMTAEEARRMIDGGAASMVSRAAATLTKDATERAKQSGQLAAYANASRAAAAAMGGGLSALESSQSGLLDAEQSGQGDVLLVQHDKNVDRRNKVAGEARAYSEFRGDTTTSVEAARQATIEQLKNIASQNETAERYVENLRTGVYGETPDGRSYSEADAIRDAIQAQTIKNLNQKTRAVVDNQVKDVEVNYDVARAEAQSTRNVAEGKQQAMAEFIEQFGDDAVTSVEAAKQAASKQMEGTVGQNRAARDFADKVSAGVYDQATVRENAAQAAAIKNINQTTNAVEAEGVGEVVVDRDVARANAQSAYNTAAGKQQATKEFMQQFGDDAVTSVEAAKQAASKQMEGTVAQNLAAEDFAYSVSAGVYDQAAIRNKAVQAGAIKNINQTTNAIASDNYTADSRITPEYADKIAKQQFDASQRAMYRTQMSDSTKTTIKEDLAAAVSQGNTNKVIAAMDLLAGEKSGMDDLNAFMRDNGATMALVPGMYEEAVKKMSTFSAEPVMKTYAKYYQKIKDANGSPVSYATWLTGKDEGGNAVNLPDLDGVGSFAAFTKTSGDGMLVGATDDTLKFYAGSGEEVISKITPVQVAKSVLSARTPKELNAGLDLLKKLPNASEVVGNLIKGLSLSEWSNMDLKTIQTLVDLDPDQEEATKRALKEKFEEVMKSGGVTAARVGSGIKDYLGVSDKK